MGTTRISFPGRSIFVHLLRTSAESVFSVLFPAECRLCARPLHNISRLPVCPDCLQSIPTFEAPQCVRCGELLPNAPVNASDEQESICGLCRRSKPAFDRALAHGPYEGSLRGLVHLLKYEAVRPAADLLGQMIAARLMPLSGSFSSKPLVIPVPLHRLRLRERGFNQAAEIASAAARSARKQGLDVQMSLSALRRIRVTRSQTGLTRHQRRENLRGAFRVARNDLVKGRDVVLVDDVLTTGATAQECARVLHRAGAAAVWVLTAARVTRLETVPALAGERAWEDPAFSIAKQAGA